MTFEVFFSAWNQLSGSQVLDSILPFEIELCRRLTKLSLHDSLVLQRLKLITGHQTGCRPIQAPIDYTTTLHVTLRVLVTPLSQRLRLAVVQLMTTSQGRLPAESLTDLALRDLSINRPIEAP